MTSVATDTFEQVVEGLDSKPPCFQGDPDHPADWIGVGHHTDGSPCVVGFSCSEHIALIDARVRTIRELSAVLANPVFECSTHDKPINGANYEIHWEQA